MSDRTLLHRNKLEMFKWWLTSIGYEIQNTKGGSEVLRAKKDSETVIIFQKQNAKEHLTVREQDLDLVKKFVRQQVEIKRKWRMATV